MVSAGLGKAERALRIAGAADAHLTALGVKESIVFWTRLTERFIGMARETLGVEADAAWEAGRRLDLRAAVAEALTSG